MADYIPGLAATYRSSFSPVPSYRRSPLQHAHAHAHAHARSHSVSAPETSKLTSSASEATPSPASPQRSQSQRSTYTRPHAPAVSSPLARTTSLTGYRSEVDVQATMPVLNAFKTLKERSSRIFRGPAGQPAQTLQISAPSQVVLPEQYRYLLEPAAAVPALCPKLSMAQVAPSVTSEACGNSSARGSASTATTSICRRAGAAAQAKRQRLQKKRQPGVLTDGEPGPSTKRFSRAPQIPALDFDAPEAVPSELEGSPEPVDQREPAVVEYQRYRVDIHATSGQDFRATMADCQQRVLSGGGVVVEDTTYLSGFIYEWPARRINSLQDSESTAQGGHIDVLAFVPALAVPEPLKSHPHTAPLDKTSEKVHAKMARSKQKLKELYGLEVDLGSPSLGMGQEDDGEWEDIE